MKVFLIFAFCAAIANAAVSPETTHLEDAEQVEEFLVDLGISSDLFRVIILAEAETANYLVFWLGLNHLDAESESFMASLTAQAVSTKAVAHAISRAKWEPDYLFLMFDDCWTATPTIVVQEYMYALENPDEMDALAILSSGTRIFCYETPEQEEGN